MSSPIRSISSFFAAVGLQLAACSSIAVTSLNAQESAPLNKFAVSERGTYGCTLEINGAIELGDSERLQSFFEGLAKDNPFNEQYFRRGEFINEEQYYMPSEMGFEFYFYEKNLELANQGLWSVCLNSPGGSYTEALKIYDQIKRYGIGTVVAEGAECLSACAIIFLAGNFQYYTTMGGNLVTGTNRAIHAGASLGFHAPSLGLNDVSGDVPFEEIGRAYSVAVTQNAELINRLSDNQLPILRRILSTPPDDMFYVDTVAKTLEVDMEVLGVEIPNEIEPKHVTAACQNASIAYTNIVSRYRPLGKPINQGPWHWLCNERSTPAEVGAMTKVRLLRTEDSMLIGELTMPSIQCREPEIKNVCRVVFSEEGVSSDGSSTRELGVSVGFWNENDNTGIPLEDMPAAKGEPGFVPPSFSWDGGPQLAYPPDTNLKWLSDRGQ